MKQSYVKKVYDFYSYFYDLIFSPFFLTPLKNVLEKVTISPEMKILDIGVGTGASLRYIPDDVFLTGIDISWGMLKKAKEKFPSRHLAVMDAMSLAFPDDTFDIAIAGFVLTVVPHPERLIEEMIRVVKKGGKIVVINHFMSSNPIVSTIEKALDPVCRKLGWRMDVPVSMVTSFKNLQVEHITWKFPWVMWKGIVATVIK